jgi:hypothetical protein
MTTRGAETGAALDVGRAGRTAHLPRNHDGRSLALRRTLLKGNPRACAAFVVVYAPKRPVELSALSSTQTTTDGSLCKEKADLRSKATQNLDREIHNASNVVCSRVRFVVALNHENPEAESVVEQNSRFTVVEVYAGAASRIARESDPRSQQATRRRVRQREGSP